MFSHQKLRRRRSRPVLTQQPKASGSLIIIKCMHMCTCYNRLHVYLIVYMKSELLRIQPGSYLIAPDSALSEGRAASTTRACGFKCLLLSTGLINHLRAVWASVHIYYWQAMPRKTYRGSPPQLPKFVIWIEDEKCAPVSSPFHFLRNIFIDRNC